MSLQGKLLRGLKWHNFRNLDGVYHIDITSNPHKMEELNIYLDFLKTRDAKKVHKILEKIMVFDLSNKPNHMAEEAKKLLDEDLMKEPEKKAEVVKKEVKKDGK